jgi:hypothetical protein
VTLPEIGNFELRNHHAVQPLSLALPFFPGSGYSLVPGLRKEPLLIIMQLMATLTNPLVPREPRHQ